MEGASGQACAPPSTLETGKKNEAVRGNFNLFHLCFTNEIRGESIDYTCKMKGGGQTSACRWWGLCPPSRYWKKEAVRGNFNLFHLYFTTFLI